MELLTAYKTPATARSILSAMMITLRSSKLRDDCGECVASSVKLRIPRCPIVRHNLYYPVSFSSACSG